MPYLHTSSHAAYRHLLGELVETSNQIMDIYKRLLFLFYTFIVHGKGCRIKGIFTKKIYIFISLLLDLLYNEVKFADKKLERV